MMTYIKGIAWGLFFIVAIIGIGISVVVFTLIELCLDTVRWFRLKYT